MSPAAASERVLNIARRSALARGIARVSLALLLAFVALSLASVAGAQIPAKTIFAGSFPNAVAVNAVTNKIYIANSSSNNVTVVDGATNTFTFVSDSSATSPIAVAVDSLTNMVYVANSSSNNVSVFSGAIGSTPAAYVTTITNGNGLNPTAVAVDAHLNQIYVANSNSGNVSIINGATNALTATVFSGSTPSAIAVNSATGFFYVVNPGSNNVAIFNGNTNTIAGTASMGSDANPTAIAVNEATDQIYVSNNGTNNVIQIDGGTNAVTGSPISNGNIFGLEGIAVNPVTNQIFVAANGGNTMVINGATNVASVANDPNASAGNAVTVDSITNTVYVANFNGTVTEFNGGNPTGTVLDFTTGGSTEAIAVNPATHRAYAACNLQNGAFTVIDGASLTPSTISPTDSAPIAIGVNPVTNLIYVANSGDNDVTVINGATNTVQGGAIGVGTDPVAMVVDPIRNQIYVVNNGEDFITDIDGASTNTAQITDSNASGLVSIAFNPVTNTGFFIGATSQTLTSFSTIFGVSTTSGDSSLTGFAPHPGPIAINPSNGQLYILDNLDNSYTVLDSVTGNSVTNGSGSAGSPVAVAINSVTNFTYIAGANGVLVVSGADLSSNVVSDPNATGPSAIAVNPVTNLVYVANSTSNNVSVFQGATAISPASYLATITDPLAVNPQAIAVNPATNKIYVVNSGSKNITVIDGVSSGILSISVGNKPVAAGVNSITNEGYIINQTDTSVSAIAEYQPQTNNLTTTISTFSGNATTTATPTFTFSATNTLSEKTEPPSQTFAPVANIYYQVDTVQGTWTPTKTQSGFSATLAAVSPGVHVIYAFATDGEDSTSTISGMQSGPTIGQISSYEFLVASEIGQFFALFGANQDFGNQAEGVASQAKAVTLENEGGSPMSFQFELNGPNAGDFTLTTPAGTNCSQLGGTLPANSQCQFFYTFQPSTLGAESATVNVTDNSTGSPVALPAFTLTGTGVPQLSVTISGGGSVSDGASFHCSAGTCTTTYTADQQITLTATPNAGSTFAGWTGDCSGTGTCSLTMSQSHTATATFTNSGPTLTVGEAGTGLGTVSSSPAGITCQPTCQANFTTGQLVTLAATPASGSVFSGWSGGGCSGNGTCVVTMNAAQSVTATFTLTAASSCPATVTSTWAGGASSNWNTATNWAPNGVPNSSSAIVCIAGGAAGPHTVTLDINPTVGGLYIDAGNTLIIANNTTLTAGGTISNSGQIQMNSAANEADIIISGATTLTGGGVVMMNLGGTQGSSSEPYIYQTNSGSLTNVNNTIEGAGIIGYNGLGFTNQAAGIVNANDPNSNVLILNTNSTNQGLYEATGKGILDLTSTVADQGGNLLATGSTALLELTSGADIQGGTLTASSGGLLADVSGSTNVTLDGRTQAVKIVGTYTLQNNSQTQLLGTINNTGIIAMNSGVNEANLLINGQVTLTGGGVVQMNLGGTQGSSSEPYIFQTNSGSLTNVNNTIEGAGVIGYNGLGFTNQAAGFVIANDPNANTLTINTGSTNQGLYEATGKGILDLTTTVANFSSNIEAVGSNALVELTTNADIQGGTLTASGGGTVADTSGNTSITLDGSTQAVNLVGTYTLQNNSQTQLFGTINNTGIIALNSGVNEANLLINGAVTLTGGGVVQMNLLGAQGTSSEPYIFQTNSGSLSNVNNLIEGAGVIGYNGLGLTNQSAGLILANDPNGNTLTINTNWTNHGLVEATGKGILNLTSTAANQGSNIEAIGSNALVELTSNADIQGGTLTASGGGTIADISGNTSIILDGSTLGALTIVGTYTLQNNSQTQLFGTINNTGIIALNSGVNEANLLINGAVTLTGGGVVQMNLLGTQGSSSEPYIFQTNSGSLSNVNNTIEGAGVIGYNGLALINQVGGLVLANDVRGNTLTLNSADTNLGYIEATGTGILSITSTINNQGGFIEAVGPATAQVQLASNADIQGGTIATNGAATFSDFAGNQSVILDGSTRGTLTIIGTYTLQNNTQTQLLGTINNTGIIAMNSTANESNLLINGPVTLTGGGAVQMNLLGSQGTSSEPYIFQTGGGALTNVNNTIEGAGIIGYNGLTLTNQAKGSILANSASGATLTINVGGTFLNQGLVETTGAGVLTFNTTVENAGQIFPNGSPNPGTINQSGGYTQDASGALDIVLVSNGVSSRYSTGNGSTVAGSVNVIFAPGFSPAVGDSWNFFSADVIDGSNFTQINAPSLGGTLVWQITNSGGNDILSIVNATTSPQTLTVTDQGTGSGTVTDDLGQINCGEANGVTNPNAVCSSSYYFNSVVNLTATPSGSSVFSGWGGACSGTGACQVTMSQAQAVTATFTPTPTSITLNFTASATPQTQEAIFDCPSNTNPCTDPNAHALALTVQGVNTPFSVTVMAEEVPTSQADGICENGNNVTNDFDCRFVSFFGGPQVTAGQEVPLCDPYSNGNCVHYLVFSGTPGTEPDPSDYTGPVNWQVTWNNESFTPPSPYLSTPRLYDDPDYPASNTTPYGTSCTTPMLVGFVNPTSAGITCQFEFDITTFFNPTETVDSGIGGTTRQFNDVVVAFPLTLSTPNLSATKTADGANVNSGSAVGYTISVSNSSAPGTASASNVALSDPLPGGAGTNWSISPAYTGQGSCSINGGVGAQVLTCSFGSIAPAITFSVHVSSSTSSSGTLNNTATITADNNSTLTASATITVASGLATTSFSNLTSSQSITAGTPTITLSGTISAQSGFPPSSEIVSITIFGLTQNASIGGDGFFSVSFPTSTIPAATTPYTITYGYAGDANFTSASNSATTLTVNSAAPGTFPLTVTLLGSGEGTVIATDTTNNNTNLINCSEANGTVNGDSTCSNTANSGDSVTLTANATSPSTFAGWGGACASFGTATTCTISMTQAQNVTANFLPGPQTVTVTFNPGTNVANMATFDCPSNPNPSPSNPCTDPNAHALNLTVPTVLSPFSVTVQAIEVPPGQADGDCEAGHTVLNDFDCRFVTFFGFGSDGNGGELVPLCNPYANGNCVHYLVYDGTPGTEPPPADYAGGVQWFITYNDDTFVPPSIYTTPPRLYDDPDYAVTPTSAVGTNCNVPMTINGVNQSYSCQFEFDITTLFVPGKKVDSGIGGTTRQFNDVVVAFPPANIAQLQATSAPDNATVTAGNPIGFTVTVTNNGSAAATNVTVNDPLPSGTGVNWTLSPAVTGCSITGTAPNQILSCAFASVGVGTSIPIHVTSATAGGGTYTNAATISINGQQLLTIATLTVSQLTSAFSGLTPSQSIAYGTPSIALGGTISSGTQFPPSDEMVTITINGTPVNATIGASGTFSTSFPTATLPASATPYTITYAYAGDSSFTSATDSSTALTVNMANQTITFTGTPLTAVYNSTFNVSASSTSGLTVTIAASGVCSINAADTIVTMTSGTGTCTLTASQTGNGNYNPATNVVNTVTATKAASTTTITSNTPNPSTPGQSVTVSFKVTGNGTPTGSVTVTATLSSTNVTCSATLSSGTGSCSVTLNTAGTWTLTAAYGGDNNFTTGSSPSVNQTVSSPSSALKFTPSSLNFGTLYVGETQLETLTVTNAGSTMVTFTNFTIQSISGDDSNDFFGISFCPKTLNAGKSCLIIMGFIADSNVTKTHAANLVITDNASGSPQTVPMTAIVINPILKLSTGSLNFGNQKVGTTSAPQPVTLSSSGTTPLVLTNIKISGDFAISSNTCVLNAQMAPGAQCAISVTFTPTKTGSRTGSLTISDNALISPAVVSLSGNGK